MKATATETDKIKPPTRKLPKVKALVIELPQPEPVQKREGDKTKEGSKQIPEDPFTTLTSDRQILAPPFNLFTLATMPEYNTELNPCLDAMEQNIEGFGHRLVPRVNVNHNEATTALKKAVHAEKVRLQNFFAYAGMKDSFKEIRRKRRRDMETTGNGYWEVIRGTTGGISYFAPMKSYQARLTPQDDSATETNMPILELQLDGSYKVKTIQVARRFRRYVQSSISVSSLRTESTGYKTSWFKEFGDPRVVDSKTGEYVDDKKQRDFDGRGNPMPEEQKANEVIHWPLNPTRSPYGLPRFVGNILDMFGDRKASEVNYVTLCNNNVPSHVIAIANGQLTEDSVERIKEFLEKLQGDDNRSKILVIEAETVEEEGEDSGHVKMDIKPLTSSQISDSLYQEYAKANREGVRVAFRLPPIFVGRSTEYNRATAETSRRLADEQIFAPEREDFDDWVNRILFPVMNVVYHRFQSNSPNTTDNAGLVRILAGAEKTGGMTPFIARMLLEDILSKELPDFPDKFDPNVPFSLTMAEAVKNQADPTEPGQQLTALKRLDLLTKMVGEEVGGGQIVRTLLELRDHLEDEWSKGLDEEDDDHDDDVEDE